MPNFINPIFSAAAAIGQGGAAPRVDMNMVHLLDLNNQMRQQTAQNDLAARQLQMGYDSVSSPSIRAGTSSQDPRYFSMTNPMTSSVLAAKKLARSTTLAGMDLTPDQQSQLDVLERDPSLGVNEYQDITHRIAEANKQQSANKEHAAAGESKKQFSNSIKIDDSTDPDQSFRTQMQSMVDDPKFSLNDLRVAYSHFQSQKTAATRTAAADKSRFIEAQLPSQRSSVTASRDLLGHLPAKTPTDKARAQMIQSWADLPAEQLVQHLSALETGQVKDGSGNPLPPLNDTEKQLLMNYRASRATLQGTEAQMNPQAQPQQQPQQQQQFQKGQIIQTPKGNVRIVGFDTDGHPLVEPA